MAKIRQNRSESLLEEDRFKARERTRKRREGEKDKRRMQRAKCNDRIRKAVSKVKKPTKVKISRPRKGPNIRIVQGGRGEIDGCHEDDESFNVNGW